MNIGNWACIGDQIWYTWPRAARLLRFHHFLFFLSFNLVPLRQFPMDLTMQALQYPEALQNRSTIAFVRALSDAVSMAEQGPTPTECDFTDVRCTSAAAGQGLRRAIAAGNLELQGKCCS
jgi:hypothetical protein